MQGASFVRYVLRTVLRTQTKLQNQYAACVLYCDSCPCRVVQVSPSLANMLRRRDGDYRKSRVVLI